MMRDLMVQVATHEPHRGPGVEIGTNEHLPQRRYHRSLLSLIMSVLVTFSVPSEKCPQKPTALNRTLRITVDRYMSRRATA